ncbi:flagellar motor protein [Leeia sp. TBRC 13508]|uniref:Flagellar motor protein n=1 Tax=Leeia speluncae TaxID=2884804 RepID=A0ABS8D663_9NEIS|nr:flagellar motor protein [Leeia speluncae]MCB6183700.1 flagellar motor protein [Leeia speluncae]
MKFDLISIGGLSLALLAILGGQFLEGGHLGSLLQLTAFMIVIGGTLGAVMLQSSLSVFVRGCKMLKWVFKTPIHNFEQMAHDLVAWSQLARRGGLLALESAMEEQQDPFIRKGLQMLVDGVEPPVLRSALWIDVNVYEEKLKKAAKVWESAGGYSPTIGILGAVLGLIHVMENLSDPSKLGAGIAVAFVATIYGVGSANLFFLPAANKLKSIIQEDIMLREMFIEGLTAIANGENPRIIEAKMKGYFEA